MPSIDLNKASWFKSSYSGTGGNCVEAAHASGTSEASWSKSSYSGAQDNCVEAAHAPAVHAVRDSRHPDAGHLVFASAEWDAFITAVKLDRL